LFQYGAVLKAGTPVPARNPASKYLRRKKPIFLRISAKKSRNCAAGRARFYRSQRK
jgi:hypothetical protein